MTKTEFNDLYDSVCYGHDAELTVTGNRVFVEWNDGKIEIFHIVNNEGHMIFEVFAENRLDTVKEIFNTCIFCKTLNDNYNEIEIFDIE